VILADILEKLRYRKKKLGIYCPEELKPVLIKFLSNFTNVATLDIDTEVFTLIKTEDRNKLTDKSLKIVVREKLIKLCFKEYCSHFDKLIYISSDASLIKKNFRNKLFCIPNEVYTTQNDMKNYNNDLIQLIAKEKCVKKNKKLFDSVSDLLNIISQKIN
jgi:hypothetical protein